MIAKVSAVISEYIRHPIHPKSLPLLLLKANIMKIVGFAATMKRKKKRRGELFGFQATVNAGCSESCRVGSWVPMFLPSSPHSLPEEFDLLDLSEYVWIYPPHWHTLSVHCNRKPLRAKISLLPFFHLQCRGSLGHKASRWHTGWVTHGSSGVDLLHAQHLWI